MRPTETPTLVERLRDEGPVPCSEVRATMGPGQRQRYDVRKFDISTRSPGAGFSATDHTRSMYYLHDEHEPAAVLRAWLATNRPVLERNDARVENITRGLGPRFQDAWTEIRDEYDWLDDSPVRDYRCGDGTADQETCPLCGADLDGMGLPGHLPDCDGGDA